MARAEAAGRRVADAQGDPRAAGALPAGAARESVLTPAAERLAGQ
jgi:hypothetical protein